ncbi:hypothetical protein SO802_023333 [Lithocarpus litseifolius]|uniref:Uncharacterized protein n=1 Tax=Lithocarpus litseifolius TaxID=425828 RepID=A0AAW2CBF7_9ROSI
MEGNPTQVHIRTRTWDLTLDAALCASPNTTRPHLEPRAEAAGIPWGKTVGKLTSIPARC